MEGSPFLPLPEGLLIASVEQTDPRLTVTVISLRPEAICPGCGYPSEHIHSQYRRIVHDVPSGGRQVVLCLHVRKFFCLHLCCSRKVFAERFPDLVQPWGRSSNRLLEVLKAIGLAASAEVSERLTPQLAMPVKSSTLLRYLRTIPDPPRTNVSSLGIDDFALKRGDKYGTILINALTGKPLDLLVDRTTEAVSPWLASHPEIQVVSRDRANGFAEAVSQVLPHALQVADRYHLVQNLRDHLQQFLDRKRTCLPFVEDTPVVQKESSPSPPQTEVSTDLSNLIAPERLKVIRRSKRLAWYEQVMALHQEGMSQREIARHLQMSRNTVQHYVSSPGFPERAEGTGQRPPGTSKLDPFLPYLRDLWDAGNHNSAHLFRLIKARGYTGCESMLRERLSEWRAELPQQRRPGNPRKPRLFKQKKQRRLSSRAASFLMILPPEKLTIKQKHQLEQLSQASSDLFMAYHLTQDFVNLLKERQAQALDHWLKCAKASRLTELVRFANGISRDYAAVYAAFSRPESNGITEGHVNRLKFLKRQMFGRANLDLLRIKVLHAV
ncbi:MAG TPA: ISL3 family transposase [Ktedonobacteraceae bacterium]|nr:ISL3 family transposase [Ktedonobacteraceae bacterium]